MAGATSKASVAASELRFMGHTLSDNRHGLIASAVVTTADGHAEREAAKVMVLDAKQAAPEKAQITLGMRTLEKIRLQAMKSG